ncbi:hypothetical protein BV898_13670 [Hypsibius exemplaris]|uniref:Uncharacterized protein n=1 Tax=Hypsibius exemplaris TaxID=2072580 RepID=A0A1W0WA17_HYPEX|nr:hypothetical protein BV898_13670 [Hypsibius exemplaris]
MADQWDPSAARSPRWSIESLVADAFQNPGLTRSVAGLLEAAAAVGLGVSADLPFAYTLESAKELQGNHFQKRALPKLAEMEGGIQDKNSVWTKETEDFAFFVFYIHGVHLDRRLKHVVCVTNKSCISVRLGLRLRPSKVFPL